MIHRHPHQRGLRKHRAADSGHIALRRSKEHRTLLWRRPPGNEPLGARDYVVRKKLDRDTASQGLHQHVDKLDGQWLRRAKRRLLGTIV
jgi:hypothetical protein